MTATRPGCDSRRVAGRNELTAFFRRRSDARRLFSAVRAAVGDAGPSTIRVTKSQIVFQRRRGFAWAWMPDRWLRGADLAPLVLSFALPRRARSRRIKEVVEPRPGRFMHHFEVRDVTDVDDEVRRWLRDAWKDAG